ncbi:MAG TPA: SRPBCC family protein [Caldilineaceae bacterium]|nr:SRPBCC family protein [Caldilineaceae bacterium]
MTQSDANRPVDREIVIARLFDAPRELVFAAWTDPKQVVQWWGPHGFTTTISEMNVRPGGVWRFVMHGPDGVDYQNQIVFVEIVKPKRLLYTHGSGQPNDPDQFEVTVTFDEQEGKTALTMRMLFATAEAREKVAAFGAIEGGKQTLDRLAEYLPTI